MENNFQQNSESDLLKADKECLWYPFTQMKDYEQEAPLIVERGEGSYLYDLEGNKYIDGISSIWTNVHGHNHPKLNKALKDQVDLISHSTMLGQGNKIAIECAKKIVEVTPEGLKRVFYSDSGSSAVEIALKMAFQYHQQAKDGDKNKTKFITLKQAYHGDTIGSVSLGGIDLFHQIYKPLIFDTIQVTNPHCYRCPFGQEEGACNKECFSHLEEMIKSHAHEAAAFVIEPLLQGAGGIITHPEGYLSRVRELCTKYNILMIADEVAVGFGKTGTMFACEQENVVPDIMAIAKGLSGGYLPLAATVTTEKVYQGFLGSYSEFKTFFHGHTFTGNALACSVAIASMNLFEEDQVIEKLGKKIDFMKKSLEKVRDLPTVGSIRQLGIMTGIEIVECKKTKKSFDYTKRIGHKVILEARKKGVILRPLGDVVVLMPPLSISEEELTTLIDVTYESIKKVTL